jgi:hypothetical protein
VYSCCAREPTLITSAGAIAYPSGARGCRVYLYDPAARTERRLAPGYLPAIWKGTLVLAHGDRDAALYARASGRTPRLDDGGRMFCGTGNRQCERASAVRYTGLDFAGSRVAVARELDGLGEFPATQMLLTGPGRRPVVVEARVNWLSFRAMRFPTLDAGGPVLRRGVRRRPRELPAALPPPQRVDDPPTAREVAPAVERPGVAPVGRAQLGVDLDLDGARGRACGERVELALELVRRAAEQTRRLLALGGGEVLAGRLRRWGGG